MYRQNLISVKILITSGILSILLYFTTTCFKISNLDLKYTYKMCLEALSTSGSKECFDRMAEFIHIPNPVIFSALAICSFLGSGLLILGFLLYKKLRTSGGDIVFGISVAEFILAGHWMISSFYSPDFPGGKDLSTDCTFCYVNAVFSVFAGVLEFLYNIFLCRYLLNFLRSSHKEVRTRHYHISAIVCAVAGVIIFALMGNLGKTLFGTCSIKYKSGSPTAYFGVLIVFAYMAICFFTFWKIRSYAPKSESSSKDVAAFLLYYNNYILSSAGIWAVYATTNLIATIDGQNSSLDPVDLATKLKPIATVGSFAKILTPLVLLFIRYRDSYIRSTMRKVVCPWRNRSRIDPEAQGGIDLPNPAAPMLKHSKSIEEEEDHRWAKVKKHRKVQFTYTILSGILFTYKKVDEATDEDEISHSKKFEEAESYINSHWFDVSNEILQRELPNLDFAGYGVFKSKFTFHAPELFQGLLMQDSQFLNLEKSLDFETNREEIMKASQAKGGKSGEFFFFSSDKKLIVKTITSKEKNRMIKILPNYVQYLEKNRNSLIAKCYGVFSLKIDNENDEYHFIVMRNVSGYPKAYVEREYDIKGSTFDREVLRGVTGLTVANLKGRGTLKDTDFFKYEKRIEIAPELATQLVAQMEKDGRFFCELGLIDYSLMVFVIDRKKYEDENPGQKPLPYHELSSLESLSYPGLYYNIGIIDYLQPYDFGKKGERCLKRTINANCSLDTSAQPPGRYSQRFTDLGKRLVYGEDTRGDSEFLI